MELVDTYADTEILLSKVLSEIYTSEVPLVIGVDWEGLARARPMSLIQLWVQQHVYVIDLYKVDPFSLGLTEIFESPKVVKVFHDFGEDCAALVSNYGINWQSIFDTQIAHRLLHQASLMDNDKVDYTQTSISLNELLKRYLNKENDKKESIQLQMSANKFFWDTRPLTIEMYEYAAQDVIHLPLLYDAFCYVFKQISKLSFSSNHI